MAKPCIYSLQYAKAYIRRRILFPADLSKRLAGERDFRDFFCLPPVKENRTQPADPAPAVTHAHEFSTYPRTSWRQTRANSKRCNVF